MSAWAGPRRRRSQSRGAGRTGPLSALGVLNLRTRCLPLRTATTPFTFTFSRRRPSTVSAHPPLSSSRPRRRLLRAALGPAACARLFSLPSVSTRSLVLMFAPSRSHVLVSSSSPSADRLSTTTRHLRPFPSALCRGFSQRHAPPTSRSVALRVLSFATAHPPPQRTPMSSLVSRLYSRHLPIYILSPPHCLLNPHMGLRRSLRDRLPSLSRSVSSLGTCTTLCQRSVPPSPFVCPCISYFSRETSRSSLALFLMSMLPHHLRMGLRHCPSSPPRPSILLTL